MRAPTEAEPHPEAGRQAGSGALLGAEISRRSFLAEPPSRHLLAVGMLLLVVAARHAAIVLFPEPINDESIYFDAFSRAARGDSPFGRSGYLAFSWLAYLGGWCLETIGPGATLVGLRLGNLAGVASVAWCSAGLAGWGWWSRLAAAAAYLVLAPAVAFGVFVGNLSLAVCGMMVVALIVWTRRPMIAGLLLGTSVVAKPLAPGAIVALLFGRDERRGRTRLVAGGLAAGVAAMVALLSPHLDEALAIDPFPRLARSVSPHRIVHLLDLPGVVIWLSAALAAVVALVALRSRVDPIRTIALATTAAIVTTPLVWSHTLLVTLPIQVICLRLAWRRHADRREGSRPPGARLELLGVVLAVAAIQFAEGATNIYDQAAWIQWLGSLPPLLAPPALTAYLWYRTRRRGSRESRAAAA